MRLTPNRPNVARSWRRVARTRREARRRPASGQSDPPPRRPPAAYYLRPTEARPQNRKSRIRAHPRRFVRRGAACSRLPPELGAGGRAGRRSRPRLQRPPGCRRTGLRLPNRLCRPNHYGPSGYFPCTVGWAGEHPGEARLQLALRWSSSTSLNSASITSGLSPAPEPCPPEPWPARLGASPIRIDARLRRSIPSRIGWA